MLNHYKQGDLYRKLWADMTPRCIIVQWPYMKVEVFRINGTRLLFNNFYRLTKNFEAQHYTTLYEGNPPVTFTNGQEYVMLMALTNCVTYSPQILQHDDVTKWKHFSGYWPFVRGSHRWPVNSPHKGQWRRALMFSLICAWINGWVNNRKAGDLRRHRDHYDVTVMNASDKYPTVHHLVTSITITGYFNWIRIAVYIL